MNAICQIDKGYLRWVRSHVTTESHVEHLKLSPGTRPKEDGEDPRELATRCSTQRGGPDQEEQEARRRHGMGQGERGRGCSRGGDPRKVDGGGEGKAACCPEQVMTLSRKAKKALRKNVQG